MNMNRDSFYSLIEQLVNFHDVEQSRNALRFLAIHIAATMKVDSKEYVETLRQHHTEELESIVLEAFGELKSEEKVSVILTSFVAQHLLNILSSSEGIKQIEIVDCCSLGPEDKAVIIPDLKDESINSRCIRVIEEKVDLLIEDRINKREMAKLKAWIVKVFVIMLIVLTGATMLGFMFPDFGKFLVRGVVGEAFKGLGETLDIIFFKA